MSMKEESTERRKRSGTILMDAPEHESMEELARLAGGQSTEETLVIDSKLTSLDLHTSTAHTFDVNSHLVNFEPSLGLPGVFGGDFAAAHRLCSRAHAEGGSSW